MIYGHIDGIIRYDGDPHILEIKSANDASFKKLKKCQSYEVWQPKYKAQIHGYMHATGIHDAVVIVYNKNNSELYSEKIEYNFNYMNALLKFVTESVTATSVPQLFCGDKTAKYCEYQGLCYGKK